jgi:hypothetical protein
LFLSVVHCAAQRFPDKLEADYDQSVALNVASTGWLTLATNEASQPHLNFSGSLIAGPESGMFFFLHFSMFF